MPRRSTTGRARLWSRLRGSRSPSYVLAATELERVFHAERSRVERRGGVFSMVVFAPAEGGGLGPGARTLRAFAKVLRDRMRLYDVLGQLDSRRLAVILPDTTPDGAWSFADATIERFSELGLKANCEVYSYPLDWRDRDGADQDDQPGGPPGGRAERERVPDESAPRIRALPTESTPAPGRLREQGLSAVRRDLGERPVRDLEEVLQVPLPLGKRLVDVLVASVLLVALTPLFLLVAVAIKVSSPGPVLFTQLRAGRGGKPFRFHKFRSMYLDAEERKEALRDQNEVSGPAFKMRNDPRITPVGRILRKLSIDELPQLYNVLIGDMTLIGPRPPTMDEVAAYEPWQRRRLDITGGLTCIWQVSGRSEIGFDEWVRMDIQYQRRSSVALDALLLFKTVGAVTSGRGAY